MELGVGVVRTAFGWGAVVSGRCKLRRLLWWVLRIIVIGLFPASSFATPPAPSYGTAVVDGDTAEWDLANDFFADMHRAGDSTKPLYCKAYLRYDCATATMYVMVLGESNVILYFSPGGILVGSWVAINTTANRVVTDRSGNDGIPPDVAPIGLGYDGVANHVLGVEASFTIQPGSYQIYMYQGVWERVAASYAATLGYPGTAPDLVIGCPVNGACCALDGTCTIVTEADCPAPGVWMNGVPSCTPNPCQQPSGACCFPDGSCAFAPQSQCTAAWLGYGSSCAPNLCQQPQGACCHPDGSCTFLLQAECADTWSGDGSSCTPNPCPEPQVACCQPDGSCALAPQSECPDTRLGYGSTCTPNPCPQPQAACCFPDGSCQFLAEAECAAMNGAWFGLNANCDPNICPQPPATGACCFTDESCEVRTAPQCAAGSGWYQGDDEPCTPATCLPPVPTERTSWGRIKSNYR